MKIRVFKVNGRDLFVLRNGGHFIAAFTWERLLMKFNTRAFKPLGETLRARFEV